MQNIIHHLREDKAINYYAFAQETSCIDVSIPLSAFALQNWKTCFITGKWGASRNLTLVPCNTVINIWSFYNKIWIWNCYLRTRNTFWNRWIAFCFLLFFHVERNIHFLGNSFAKFIELIIFLVSPNDCRLPFQRLERRIPVEMAS